MTGKRLTGDLWSDPQLGERLSALIAASRSVRFRSSMSPALSYGRHRGPAQDTSRLAAVVIALYQVSYSDVSSSRPSSNETNPSWDLTDGEWVIPLTMRPKSLQHHGGQICLPGGRVEQGESASQAALREYEEELGLRPVPIARCGELSSQYVFGSDNQVRPIVVTINPPDSDWIPDPVEVAEVIPLPLKVLLTGPRTELTKTRQVCQAGSCVDQLNYRAPAIRYGEHVIWGATAVILDELAQILHGG